jgi:hypothetical protein
VVERIIDGISVGVLGIVALHMLATTGKYAEQARITANLVTAGFGALLLALLVAFVMRARAVALVRTLLSPVSPRLAARGAHMLDSFVAGLHLGSAGRVLAVLGLTVIHWILHVWGFWMVAPAFGIQLTGLMASTVLAANVVGVMIPAGPGGLGPSQLATLAGVSIFYPDALTNGSAMAISAVAYAMTIWALQFLQAATLGVVFLVSGHVSLDGLFEPPERLEAAADPATSPPA